MNPKDRNIIEFFCKKRPDNLHNFYSVEENKGYYYQVVSNINTIVVFGLN